MPEIKPHIECVSTFNAAGFNAYGKKFVESFMRHWHGDIGLSVYNEGAAGEFVYGQRVRFLSYEQQCPEGVAFKEPELPQAPEPAANAYRFDAKRFSHKAFALAAAARRTKADYLVLMDADIETHSYVSPEWVAGLLEEGEHVACLKRPWYHHSECAFVLYRMGPKTRDMIQSIEDCYTGGHIFSLDGWCDSSVFDYIRGRFEAERGLVTRDLTEGKPEDGLTVFENSALGRKMTHNKGRRKFVDHPIQRAGLGAGQLAQAHGPDQPHP